MSGSPELTPFDPVDYLTDDASMEAFLQDALESGERMEIADALGVIARAKGLKAEAAAAGLPEAFLAVHPVKATAPDWPVLLEVISRLGFALTPVTIKPAA